MTKGIFPSPDCSNRQLGIKICLILFAATLVAYWQVKSFEFVHYDDNVYVTENPNVQAGLSSESINWAFTTTHGSNWHPLTWISHMLDCEIFGMNPGWHHLTSLVFHIANTLLLFLVIFRMTGAPWLSWFVAALFALHPLHVESVAWVAERKDVLSTFFWLLTMWAYVRYVQQTRMYRYLFVLFFFALGLMAKPMLVTLPFILLLMDFWPLGRPRWGQPYSVGTSNFREVELKTGIKKSSKKKKKRRKKEEVKNRISRERYTVPVSRLIIEKVPLFGLTLISSFMTFVAQQKGGAVVALETKPLAMRTANALVSYVSYIGKMIWPHRLAVFYPYPESIPAWQAACAGLFLVFVSFIFVKKAQKFPYLVVGWLWYLGTLVPVIGVVQVGAQSMADRYTYIPLIGLFILTVWGFSDIVKKWRNRRVVVSVLGGGLLFVFGVCTWFQAGHWRNSVALFTRALSVTRNNSVAHNNIGFVLASQGNLEQAIKHYSEALRIKSDYDQAHNNLGIALGRQGKLDEAVSHFREALKINPDYAKAHHNLGIALGRQGNIEDAAFHFRKAISLKPDYYESHYNLGIAFMQQGRVREAVRHFREVLRLRPDHQGARKNLKEIQER